MKPLKKNEIKKSESPVVAYRVHEYYELSSNWIHTQVQHLTRYHPIILTEKTANLGDHEFPEYCALEEQPRVERWMNWISGRIVDYPASFSRMIRQKNAQLLHAHFGFTGYRVLPLAKRTRLPLITSFYGVDISKLPKKYPNWRKNYVDLFQYGTRFLVEGNHMGRQLMHLGCPENKIRVQHLGIDLARYPFEPRQLEKGLPLKILAVARFTEKKGLLYVIEALAKLVGKNVKAKLTIIGDAASGGDPDYVEESQATKQLIMNAITNSGIADKITLLGFQPHEMVEKEYYAHHVFLSPSVQAESGDNEGGAPVTLIEAGASGMPIISTHHCDIPEVIQDGVTGMLAPERNSDALAACLLTIMNKPQQMLDMGMAAHKHIAKEYDARTQGSRLEEIYDEVVREPF